MQVVDENDDLAAGSGVSGRRARCTRHGGIRSGRRCRGGGKGRTRRSPARHHEELRRDLGLSVFEDLEVGLSEVADHRALGVEDHGVELDDFRARAGTTGCAGAGAETTATRSTTAAAEEEGRIRAQTNTADQRAARYDPEFPMNCPRSAFLLSAALAAYGATASAADRTVAVTFDDLPGPAVALLASDVPTLRENTRKLLAAFRDATVPVVGFVNEGKLFVEGETPAVAEQRIDVLRSWVADGHELGNHTYSHRSLNTQPLDGFEQDVVRGEAVTRRLLAGRSALRYFRHPFLHVGLDLDKRRAFETFLAGRGYTIAPVTIDNDEYIYAAAYADARRRGDEALATRLADDYLRYMETVFAFVEGVSRGLLGARDPAGPPPPRQRPQRRSLPGPGRDDEGARLSVRDAGGGPAGRGLPPARHVRRRVGHLLAAPLGRSREGASARPRPIRRTG